MADPGPDTVFAPAWVGSAREFRWLELVFKSVLVLNILDAILTMVWISDGRAIEANPLLSSLAHNHPLGFVCVKLALVSLGVTLLWRHRGRPLAVVAAFVSFLAYFFVLLYHLHAMHLDLLRRLFH